MINKLVSTAIIFFVVSCGSPTPKTEEEKESSQQQIQTKDTTPQQPQYDFWNSSNAEEKLTQYGKENKEKKAIIHTKFGDIEIELFEDTPLHRANFVRLSKMKFYDSTLFFRIKKNFMIQGGIIEGESSYDRDVINIKVGSYRIPSEIKDHYPHTRGMVAMANNSYSTKEGEEKDYKSDPYNFYIVHGKNVNSSLIKKTEARYGIDISPENEKRYKKEGGAPHLDMQYTVFGRVTKGMDVVNKIASTPTDKDDRPKSEVYIQSIEIK